MKNFFIDSNSNGNAKAIEIGTKTKQQTGTVSLISSIVFDLMIIAFESKYSIDFQFAFLFCSLIRSYGSTAVVVRDNSNIIKIKLYDDFDFSMGPQ